MNGGRPSVDILVPIRNDFTSARTLFDGIYLRTDFPFHLFVIDTESGDEARNLLKIYTRDITIVQNRGGRGIGPALNRGLRMGSRPFVVFLHPRVRVSEGWLANLIGFLETHPRIGAVGPLTSNPEDWQCVDRVRERLVTQIPDFFTEDLHDRNRILQYHFRRAGILVDRALGSFCLVVRRRTLDEVGFPDKSSNDPIGAYCGRLRKAGYVLGLSLDTYVDNDTLLSDSSPVLLPVRRRPGQSNPDRD